MKPNPSALEEWLLYIQSIHFRSADLDLDRVRRVKHRLRLRRRPVVITVAGTNGKGSSVAMLEAIFQHAGREVGTFTSPHLIRYQERIRIGGTEISKDSLTQAFLAVEIARGNIPLTFFEFGTIAALLLFQEAEVEIAILEVGLGGRLDAVNTENQDITLLTPISIDHQKWLGSTREQIGREKAGILKNQGNVVINDPKAPASLVHRARVLDCRFVQAGLDYLWELEGAEWTWKPKGPIWNSVGLEEHLPIASLAGEHQVMNAAGVVSVVKLMNRHLRISRSALDQGLSLQCLRGRVEIFPGAPEVIVDVAHNVAAVQSLLKFLTQRPVFGRTIAVFAALQDKSVLEMVDLCSSAIDKWYITELTDERALRLEQLEKVVVSVGITQVRSMKSGESAFVTARREAKSSDRIVVFGSTYLAGGILELLDNERDHA